MNSNLPSTTYQKHHSFDFFYSQKKTDIEEQQKRCLRLLEKIEGNSYFNEILSAAKKELTETQDSKFKITTFIADEISLLEDSQIPNYLFHRYRYDVFPQEFRLDDYPPYLQIEPSSICNYQCVFCYQTDRNYFTKSSGKMGGMSLDLYKKITDEILGKVEFLSLASRGEPLLCKDMDSILEYVVGKHLVLKLNTNASMLNEKHIHAILAGGVRTVVFSADAAEEPLYSQLRVNGKLEKVLKNIELFQKIRETEYSKTKIISRVSGVKVQEEQAFDKMKQVWGGLVDQVVFVKYNPWENIYESEANGIQSPCSDLWRRMFVWFDGEVNPCDSDYRSTLSMGKFPEVSITDLWRKERYTDLRNAHLNKARQVVEPCKKCSVI